MSASSSVPRWLVAVIGLPLAAVGMPGCATTRTIDGGKLDPHLIGVTPPGLNTHARVRTASCPDGVPDKKDQLVRCRVRLSDGSTGTWVWVVTDETTGSAESSFYDVDKNNPPKPMPPRHVVGDTQAGPAEPTRLKVTLTRFVPPRTGAKSQVSEADFRVTNVGRKAFRDDFGFASDVGMFTKDGGSYGDPVRERRPCGAPFYASVFRLAPGQTVQGCVWFKPNGETAGYGPPVVVSIFLDTPVDWSVAAAH